MSIKLLAAIIATAAVVSGCQGPNETWRCDGTQSYAFCSHGRWVRAAECTPPFFCAQENPTDYPLCKYILITGCYVKLTIRRRELLGYMYIDSVDMHTISWKHGK
jgi:hypothetical protein